METTPFLSAAEFAAMIAPRTLTAAQTLLVELVVQAAADWIRADTRRPGLLTTDPLAKQAKLITYDVALEALGPSSAPSADRSVRSVTQTTDGRTTTVAYSDAVGLLDLNQDRYLRWLGLSLTAEPRATFDDFSTAFVETDAYGRRLW